MKTTQQGADQRWSSQTQDLKYTPINIGRVHHYLPSTHSDSSLDPVRRFEAIYTPSTQYS